jgi:uncharacterized pyridoxamine 5'-phosphate oxidase family protein
MEKIINFLNECHVFYMATTEGNQPRVRPFGLVFEVDGKLCVCTGNKKDVYKQIMINPNVEMSAFKGDMWIRVSGKLTDKSSPENTEKVFQINPNLREIYIGREKEFAVLCFESGEAKFINFMGIQEIVEL